MLVNNMPYTQTSHIPHITQLAGNCRGQVARPQHRQRGLGHAQHLGYREEHGHHCHRVDECDCDMFILVVQGGRG